MDAEALWKNLRQGDRTAFEQLYRQHATPLLQYAYHFSSDRQLAEDCLQDMFIDLWNKHEQLSDVKSVRSYLMVSLRRAVVRKLKQKQRFLSDQTPEDSNTEVTVSIDEEWCLQELKSEQVQQLKSAIEQLSNRQKEALYLKYQQGMDYDEICETMGLNYQSARNLIAAAIRKLKGIMYWLLVFLSFN